MVEESVEALRTFGKFWQVALENFRERIEERPC